MHDVDSLEILALLAPAPTMVLNCRQNPLYTLSEMQRADVIIAASFKRANAPDRYRAIYYEGGHKYDCSMQADAFNWFDEAAPGPPVQRSEWYRSQIGPGWSATRNEAIRSTVSN